MALVGRNMAKRVMKRSGESVHGRPGVGDRGRDILRFKMELVFKGIPIQAHDSRAF